MTKAEERANEAFPNDDVKFLYEYEPGKYSPVTTWGREKYGFVKGYSQAEKDLALSIDDIEKIHTFLYAVKNNKQGVFTFTRLSDEQYEEVLRRFKKAEEEKQ